MHLLDEILWGADPCWPCALCAALLLIGNWMAGTRQQVRTWGLRLAAAAFLTTAVLSLILQPLPNAEQVLGTVLRSLGLAGMVLGISWIVGPAVEFMITSAIVPLWAALKARRGAARARTQEQERARREAERVQREQAEWLTGGPRREQARLAAEAQARAEADAARRRADAAARCELLYHLLAPEISTRLSRTAFDDLMNKYLRPNDLPPETAEARAERVCAFLQEHLTRVAAPATAELEARLQALLKMNLPPAVIATEILTLLGQPSLARSNPSTAPLTPDDFTEAS